MSKLITIPLILGSISFISSIFLWFHNRQKTTYGKKMRDIAWIGVVFSIILFSIPIIINPLDTYPMIKDIKIEDCE